MAEIYQYVTHGLASNGHDRYWAVCRDDDAQHYWDGPFRASRERAQDDLDRHIARHAE